jgi:hypothetical protein
VGVPETDCVPSVQTYVVVVVMVVGTEPPAEHCAVVAATAPFTLAVSVQVVPLAWLPHAGNVSAVVLQTGVPFVVVLTGVPETDCVPLVQTYVVLVAVVVGTVPPFGHCAAVAAAEPFTVAVSAQVEPLAWEPQADAVAAVQTGDAVVILVTGVPEAV